TTIPVNTAGSNCSFDVPVVGPGTFTVNCGSAQVNGTYEQGVALGAGNFVKVDVTVATAGAYTITSTVNGMTFTGSGTFAGTGVQNITLQGSGVPQAEETSTVNINAGATPCSFDVTVEAGAPGGGTGSWQFVENGVTYSGSISDVEYDPTTGAPATSLIFTGGNAANDEFDLGLVDIAGGIKAGDIYKTFLPISPGENIGLMYFFGADPKTYTSDPTIPTTGTTLTVNITVHNLVSKNIMGTFTGKVINEANVLKDITNGSFSVTYP
ncbi:MAG TPA: hypothetical protein VK644_09360, partial [Chitinophagaceae bacterium]|nr:hypothetical protein [Chitinophagaceae bacterium]